MIKFLSKHILYIIFLYFIILYKSYALDKVTLAVGEWAPYVSQELPDYGMSSKIVKEAFAAKDISVKFEWVPWKRALLMVKALKADASYPWIITEERKLNYIYSDYFGTSPASLFYLKDKNISWKEYNDLGGYVVAGTIGYSYGQDFDNAAKNNIFEYQTAASDLSSLRKLFAGRVDLFACDIYVCSDILKANFTKNQAEQVTYTDKYIIEDYLRVIVGKNNPNSKEIIDAFNEGLAIVKNK